MIGPWEPRADFLAKRFRELGASSQSASTRWRYPMPCACRNSAAPRIVGKMPGKPFTRRENGASGWPSGWPRFLPRWRHDLPFRNRNRFSLEPPTRFRPNIGGGAEETVDQVTVGAVGSPRRRSPHQWRFVPLRKSEMICWISSR